MSRNCQEIATLPLRNGARPAAKGKYVHCGATHRDEGRGGLASLNAIHSCPKVNPTVSRAAEARSCQPTRIDETSPLIPRQRSNCTGILVSAFHCWKEQVGLNDVDQSVIQTHPKSGFSPPPGRPYTSNAAPVAGYGSLRRIRWRSKKLDKTSRLVRMHHRIFRSLRGWETVLLGKRNLGRPHASHFCKIWFSK
jgi:hypothetical protein